MFWGNLSIPFSGKARLHDIVSKEPVIFLQNSLYSAVKEYVESGKCWLTFSPRSFVFPYAVKRNEVHSIWNYDCALPYGHESWAFTLSKAKGV